jgi:hypothetical protein
MRLIVYGLLLKEDMSMMCNCQRQECEGVGVQMWRFCMVCLIVGSLVV